MGFLKREPTYNYFEGFLDSAKYATEEARFLRGVFEDFDPNKIVQNVSAMHKIESAADSKKHEIMHHLAKEFLPPIEREDVSALSQELDNIVDAVEDVMQRIYMFNVTSLRQEALPFAQLIVDGCEAFETVVSEFKTFKKSSTLKDAIIRVNTLESKGDELHTQALRRLFTSDATAVEKLVWTSIFESLESCLDACEQAADIIESVIIENT